MVLDNIPVVYSWDDGSIEFRLVIQTQIKWCGYADGTVL